MHGDTSPVVCKQRKHVVSLYSVLAKSHNANNDNLLRYMFVSDVTLF